MGCDVREINIVEIRFWFQEELLVEPKEMGMENVQRVQRTARRITVYFQINEPADNMFSVFTEAINFLGDT